MDSSTEDLEKAVGEALQAVEAPFKIEKHQSSADSTSGIFEMITKEYFQLLEQPKRLPFFFHPFLSKDRAIDVTGRKTLFTPHFYLVDERNVPRRFFVNLDIQNLALGALGGLTVGLCTQKYFLNHGHLAKISSQKWLRQADGNGDSKIQKLAAGSAITWRILKRAAVGAGLFEFLKRNAETQRDKDDWMNAAFAGGISGALFGIRGGLPAAIFGAAGFAVGGALHSTMYEPES